ncbi:MAG: hypothetical protein IPI35_20550 [Deltaproteobacteria bacterium]|nr:hypothetical protein [Deltaproteobacteria bacterium]
MSSSTSSPLELKTPRALAELPSVLAERVGRPVPEAEILAWLALGAATGRGGFDPLLRPVAHSFVRGVGGAVVTFSNPGPTARLWLAGEEAEAELGDSFRRFPVITCTTCGQHYYEAWVKDFALETGAQRAQRAADQVGSVRVWPHQAEETEGQRALLVDRLVVRPDEDDDDSDDVDDEGNALPPTGHGFEHRRLHPMFVCRRCGALQEARTDACAACHTTGSQVEVQVVRHREEYPGLLHSCVACQAPGRRPGRRKLPRARPPHAPSASPTYTSSRSR